VNFALVVKCKVENCWGCLQQFFYVFSIKKKCDIITCILIKNESNEFILLGGIDMKHIKTLNRGTLKSSAAHGGCGECQTSCQSACKTSCTVGNQECENK
jgi:predicted ribosomally synthesized six-cysteine peptide SCIFF